MHYVGSNTVAAGLSIHVGGARGGCVGKGGAGWDQYHSVPSPPPPPPPPSPGVTCCTVFDHHTSFAKFTSTLLQRLQYVILRIKCAFISVCVLFSVHVCVQVYLGVQISGAWLVLASPIS